MTKKSQDEIALMIIGACLGFFSGLLLFIIYCTVQGTYKTSPRIVLIGGGSVPPKAIQWAKEGVTNSLAECIVVSCSDEINNRWDKFFNNVRYIKPEDLIRIDIRNVSFLVIEGGDQFAYLNRLRKDDLQRYYDKGITLITTSASAVLMGEHYFTAEHGTINSYEAKEQPELVTMGSNYLKVKYLNDTVIDTHFTERNRIDRLRVFMEKSKAKFGIGIDEDTALCIGHFGDKSVFGSGNVHIIKKGK